MLTTTFTETFAVILHIVLYVIVSGVSGMFTDSCPSTHSV